MKRHSFAENGMQVWIALNKQQSLKKEDKMGTKSALSPTKSLRKAEGLGSICLRYIQMDII